MSPVRDEGLTILKIGGGGSINHLGIAQGLAAHTGPVVVVLGANAVRGDIAASLGTPPRIVTSVSGVDSVFSDDQAIDLMMMAYSGLASGRFVSTCQQQGVNAIGLSGVDGALVRGRRNRGIKVREDGRKRLLRDRSGKPTEVNAPLLQSLLDDGYVPVVTVPILDEDGVAVNTDNDSIVAQIQQALGAHRVIHLLEAAGLMRDIADPSSLIDRLSFEELAEMSSAASGRIQRKLMALESVASAGCREIIVADGRSETPLEDAFAGKGTAIDAVGGARDAH